nr:hypothetical protein [Desulfobacula sp.]
MNVIKFPETKQQMDIPDNVDADDLLDEISFLFYAVGSGQLPPDEATEILMRRFV